MVNTITVVGAGNVGATTAQRIAENSDRELADTGAIGGTLAGNALAPAAMRATVSFR